MQDKIRCLYDYGNELKANCYYQVVRMEERKVLVMNEQNEAMWYDVVFFELT